ncbi:MAG: PepSY-associated TM helix domain-containing protein [Pseudomonadota bacterium]
MKIRTVIFWAHLVAGDGAGLVILLMSVTGVLLTYERQMTAWSEDSYLAEVEDGAEMLPADDLLAVLREAAPEAEQLTLIYSKEPGSIVRGSAGRGRPFLIDPYRGEILLEGATATDRFFTTVMYVHRWFALTGDSRGIGRAITGYSNLLFFFLLLSGTYLWLPRIWTWAAVKTKVFFNARARTGKARDFNWHHVFSFWAFVPLLFVIPTASVFYFPWANDLLYGAFGEEPPERRRGARVEPLAAGTPALSKQALLERALTEVESRSVDDWKTVSMQVGAFPQTSAQFRIDESIGGQPQAVSRLTLSATDGAVQDWRTFADNTPGSQARSVVRFLHTGEVLGFIGQTLAGLASLAACFLVWTGLALAWRRLISPLLRRSAAPPGAAHDRP